jgi:hypothetical protein
MFNAMNKHTCGLNDGDIIGLIEGTDGSNEHT